jgi:hypothetical protein
MSRNPDTEHEETVSDHLEVATDVLTEWDYADLLHTPQVPPSLAQCLQYLQFLHALHGSAPTQVANEAPEAIVMSTTQTRALGQTMCASRGM